MPTSTSWARKRRWPQHLAARAATRAVSLVELMIVVAVAAIIIGLAAPSFSDYILTQRVRSVHAQLATDLQFARAEAVSRSAYVSVRFQFTTGDSGASCYIIFTRPDPTSSNSITCNCLDAPGSRCSTHPTVTTEVRTVTVPNSLKVNLRVAEGQPDTMTFDPRTGGLKFTPVDVAVLDQLSAQQNTGSRHDDQADGDSHHQLHQRQTALPAIRAQAQGGHAVPPSVVPVGAHRLARPEPFTTARRVRGESALVFT
jgi:type IV fimbrial biogenesis protein FimT